MVPSQLGVYRLWFSAWKSALLSPSVATFANIVAMVEPLRAHYRWYTYSTWIGVWIFGQVRASQHARHRAEHSLFGAAISSVLFAIMVGAMITMTFVQVAMFLIGLETIPPNSIPFLIPQVVFVNALSEILFFDLVLSVMITFPIWILFIIWLVTRGVFCWIISRKNRWSEFAIVTAAYCAPLAIVVGVFRSIPYLGYVIIVGRLLYEIYLSIIATKVVYELSWMQTLIVNMLSVLSLILIAVLLWHGVFREIARVMFG